MLSLKECYERLKKKYPNGKVRACRDFGTFFLFNMIPKDVSNDARYMSGSVFDAVDKKTGRIYYYSIAEHPNEFRTSKSIDIKTLR